MYELLQHCSSENAIMIPMFSFLPWLLQKGRQREFLENDGVLLLNAVVSKAHITRMRFQRYAEQDARK